MEEQTCAFGVVTEVSGKTAKVRFQRSPQCSHCGACLTVGEHEMELELNNPVGAKVGDRVRVSLSPKRVVQASLLAYAVPLALLIFGVWLGSGVSDWFGLVLGVAACGGSYFILRAVEKKSRDKNRFRPRIEAIAGGGEDAGTEERPDETL